MVTVKVCYKSDGSPARDHKVSVSVSGLVGGFVTSPEYTNSEGEAHFDVASGEGEVYVNGRTLHKGRIAGRIVVYV